MKTPLIIVLGVIVIFSVLGTCWLVWKLNCDLTFSQRAEGEETVKTSEIITK